MKQTILLLLLAFSFSADAQITRSNGVTSTTAPIRSVKNDLVGEIYSNTGKPKGRLIADHNEYGNMWVAVFLSDKTGSTSAFGFTFYKYEFTPEELYLTMKKVFKDKREKFEVKCATDEVTIENSDGFCWIRTDEGYISLTEREVDQLFGKSK
jgi:hypothetical protein